MAINDNVDTANGESEFAPFLNILNEMHARQTSKKVKAAMHTLFVNGAHYGAYAPIGYKKDPNQVGHLIVDEDTKWIVKKMFDLAAAGAGMSKITKNLTAEKIPTPGLLELPTIWLLCPCLYRCPGKAEVCLVDYSGSLDFEGRNIPGA